MSAYAARRSAFRNRKSNGWSNPNSDETNRRYLRSIACVRYTGKYRRYRSPHTISNRSVVYNRGFLWSFLSVTFTGNLRRSTSPHNGVYSVNRPSGDVPFVSPPCSLLRTDPYLHLPHLPPPLEGVTVSLGVSLAPGL